MPTRHVPSRLLLASIDCTSGSFCLLGASAPLPCPSGRYQNASLRVMTSEDDCIECPEGTFCSVGSAVATDCAPGTYNAAPRSYAEQLSGR